MNNNLNKRRRRTTEERNLIITDVLKKKYSRKELMEKFDLTHRNYCHYKKKTLNGEIKIKQNKPR